MPPVATTDSQLLALDSHVHFHDLTDLPGLLDSTLQTLNKAASHAGTNTPLTGLLVLTEPRTRPTFAGLRQRIGQHARTEADAWTLAATGEEISLQATRSGGERLFLLSGQQIVTRENLEVLSLLATPEVPDGLPLAKTVACVLRLGGLPVLPWGVGKWLGARGRIVSDFLETNQYPVFVGDNGGRPAFWQSIPQFDQARAAGIAILRGSDPLRCSHRRRGAGSFGNLLACPLDPARPAMSLRMALNAGSSSLADFGRLERPWYFLKDQLALRIG